ncbi:sugar transferase [Sphingomonas radiodurans]|uniref:sugar transferase n=1 Tax=Sphingomonas radiodurans TaxID=2890321 RepID=UPI001E61C238|nr:sugar transferase [Sphingomonas radiodurans]WBH17817.1 sugar transferase [Sphingomonas radiodurans]
MTDHAPTEAFPTERRQDMARRVRFESDMRGVPLHLEVRRGSYARRLKPVFDAVVALAALIVLSPLLVIVAIAIKLDDRGPVFFIQRRTGYLGHRFRLFKFRTMVVDAEALKAKLRAHNIHAPDSPDFKLANDPRVTRVGRILRKTSIDELPNLWNVVRGDMALVGPRPTSFDASTYRMPHLPRLAAKPGLTGLWQVSGRANIDFDERAELDMRYIRSLSAKQDLHLIVRTINAVKKGDGAC